jgi:hypothetical protein
MKLTSCHKHSKPIIHKQHYELYDQCLPLEEQDVHIFLPFAPYQIKSNNLKTRTLLEHKKTENLEMCL